MGDLENLGQLPVQQVLGGSGDCTCLINFHSSFTIHVFEGKESISGSPTELPCSGDLENPGQFPVS